MKASANKRKVKINGYIRSAKPCLRYERAQSPGRTNVKYT